MSHASTTLAGCQVVDLGLGMASALITKMLKEMGASVVRFEPASGDPFYATLPAYRSWHDRKTINRIGDLSAPEVDAALSSADVCVLGGDDLPGLDWRPDVEALARRYPSLVVLSIDGYPPGSPAAGRPSAEALVAARSGAVFEHFSARPVLTSIPVATYGAAAQGSAAVLAALVARRRTGRGGVARVSMLGGTLMWNVSSWMGVENPDTAYHTFMPKDAQQLIFRCADGVHVQITMGVPGAKDRLYAILGIDSAPTVVGDRALPSLQRDPRQFFGDVDLLQAHFGKFQSAQILGELSKADIPAEPLLPPGGCWDDPQVIHNGILTRDGSGVQHVGLAFEVEPGPGGPVALGPLSATGALPLAGLRVLDLGTVIGGPYSSMVLQDLGAEVIRLEALTGDIIRGFARWFAAVSRGKRAIAADLKAPEAIALVHRLAKKVDVVHHNFRPGVAERLGLGPTQLHALNPNLVVLETFGYGATGPKAGLPGFDMVFQAWCGHESRGGGAAHGPLWYRAAMVDYMAGALGAMGVLAALLHAQGAGSTVRTSLLNAGLSLMSELVRRPDGTFSGAPPADEEQLGANAAERLYRVSDGWIAICVRGTAMAQAFARVLGLQQALEPDPSRWGEPERARIAGVLASWSTEVATAALDAAAIWNEVCRPEVEQDFLAGSGDAAVYRLEAEHPRYGRTVQIGPLVRFDGARSRPDGRIPALGEHTTDVLSELGYTLLEIEGLRARKIVR